MSNPVTIPGIRELTGDGTAGPGSGSQVLILATVNGNVGAFTNANIVVNAKGQITAAANGSVNPGTVTSVALALPAIFTVSGSPVTSSGTLTGTLATQAANLIFAGPASGAAAAPTFRAIASLDLTTALTTPPVIGGATPAAITGTIITATTRFVGPIIAPSADSTAALRFTKADGTTAVMTVDTTNSRIGIGVTPAATLDIQGAAATTALKIKASASSGPLSILVERNNNTTTVFSVDGTGLAFMNLIGIGIPNDTAHQAIISSGSGSRNTLSLSGSAGGSSTGNLFNVYKEASFSNLVFVVNSTGIVTVTPLDTATVAVTNVLILDHNTSGTPSTGFGTGISFLGKDSSTASISMGQIRTEWTTATHLSQVSKMVFTVYDTTAHDALILLNPNNSQMIVGPLASGYTAIGFMPTLTATNYTLTGSAADTFINSQGDMYFRYVNADVLKIAAGATLVFSEAKNIAFGTTTGTKIGTATTQKLAFWNATPIIQPTTAIAGATFVVGVGVAVSDASTFDGYTLGQIVKALRNEGLLA